MGILLLCWCQDTGRKSNGFLSNQCNTTATMLYAETSQVRVKSSSGSNSTNTGRTTVTAWRSGIISLKLLLRWKLQTHSISSIPISGDEVKEHKVRQEHHNNRTTALSQNIQVGQSVLVWDFSGQETLSKLPLLIKMEMAYWSYSAMFYRAMYQFYRAYATSLQWCSQWIGSGRSWDTNHSRYGATSVQ